MQLSPIALGSNSQSDAHASAPIGMGREIGSENHDFARALDEFIQTVSVSYDEPVDLASKPPVIPQQLVETPETLTGNGLPHGDVLFDLAGKNQPRGDAERASLGNSAPNVNVEFIPAVQIVSPDVRAKPELVAPEVAEDIAPALLTVDPAPQQATPLSNDAAMHEVARVLSDKPTLQPEGMADDFSKQVQGNPNGLRSSPALETESALRAVPMDPQNARSGTPVSFVDQSATKPTAPVMPVLPGSAPKANGARVTSDEGGEPAKPTPLDVPVARVPDKIVQGEAARNRVQRDLAANPQVLADERAIPVALQAEPITLARQGMENALLAARPFASSAQPNNALQAPAPLAPSQNGAEISGLPAGLDSETTTLAQPRGGQAQPVTASAQPIASQVFNPAPNPIGEAAPTIRDTAPLERLVETVTQMRESGQVGRGEIALRHAEFGTISMQVTAGDGDIQARLNSRDPSFAVAAQAAMVERAAAERSVSATQETASNSARNPDSDGGASDQGQSRFNGQLSENGQSRDRDANRGGSATREEHGGVGLSSDDHSSPNSDATDRRDGALFA